MANKQYIGARYVPKYFENPNGSNEWLSGIAYEALTIVKFADNWFISNKPVPNTIGEPNVNTEYWINQGSSGGSAPTDLTDVYNKIQANTDEINSIKDVINKNCLYIGNSFSTGGTIDGIYDLTKHIFNETWLYANSGSGFATLSTGAERFLSLLTTASNELTEDQKNSITHILFISAFGDSTFATDNGFINEALFYNSVSETVTFAKTNFPNATVYVYLADASKTNRENGYGYCSELWCHQFFKKYLNKAGACYLGWGGWEITLNNNYFDTDPNHPNQLGYNLLAQKLIESFTCGISYSTRKNTISSLLGTNVACNVTATPDISTINFTGTATNVTAGSNGELGVVAQTQPLLAYTNTNINGLFMKEDNSIIQAYIEFKIPGQTYTMFYLLSPNTVLSKYFYCPAQFVIENHILQ